MEPNPIYRSQPRASVPNYSHSSFNASDLANYVGTLTEKGSSFSSIVNAYPTTATIAATGAYYGSVYSPTQNRIYFVPAAQGITGVVSWHFIDCNTGAIVAYDRPANGIVGGESYVGGAFSPIQNRIYFAPNSQGAPANAFWHYIDCNTSGTTSANIATPVSYAHGVTTVDGAYAGGVYSPTQNRIYFVPFSQAPQTNWHYVDCNTGTIMAYAHGLATPPVNQAYAGGVYSPTQNRIYFSPYEQSASANALWHYIDCNTGTVGLYNNPLTAIAKGYTSGAYSPIQNRIYFAPRNQAIPYNPVAGAGVSVLTKFWHYIDCKTGLVGTYLNPNTGSPNGEAYSGATFSPVQNRIYFSPYNQCTNTNTVWHYIDCNTGVVGTYPNPGGIVNQGFNGSLYSPTQNRIYLVPYSQSGGAQLWSFLDMQSNAATSKVLMSGAEFNLF